MESLGGLSSFLVFVLFALMNYLKSAWSAFLFDFLNSIDFLSSKEV